MAVDFKDHRQDVKKALEGATERALVRCGLEAEGYAKNLTPADTGLLRNSITFALSGESANISQYSAEKGGEKGSYSGTAPEATRGKSVYVGTNVEYAPYVELGTGAKNTPGGRPDPWGYVDGQGNAHHTAGQKAQPYLKPAVANHKRTYQNIIKDELENA